MRFSRAQVMRNKSKSKSKFVLRPCPAHGAQKPPSSYCNIACRFQELNDSRCTWHPAAAAAACVMATKAGGPQTSTATCPGDAPAAHAAATADAITASTPGRPRNTPCCAVPGELAAEAGLDREELGDTSAT